MQACKIAGLRYKKHGRYVTVLLSEIRCQLKIGLPLKPQELPHMRTFRWENMPRSLWPDKSVLPDGWIESKNRNNMWVFRGNQGVIHWFPGGVLMLYLEGPIMLSKAKELFCQAFHWIDIKKLEKYLDAPLIEKRRHWVFDVGALMPNFDIRKFERSHGLRIFTDGSHPSALEVEESTPFWLTSLQDVTQDLSKDLNLHMDVLQAALGFYNMKDKPRKKNFEWEI